MLLDIQPQVLQAEAVKEPPCQLKKKKKKKRKCMLRKADKPIEPIVVPTTAIPVKIEEPMY